MQFLKGDIQERILKVAEEVFLEKGYKDASMREMVLIYISTLENLRKAGVGKSSNQR